MRKAILSIQLLLIFMSALLLFNYMEFLSSLYYNGPFQMSSNTVYFHLQDSSLGSSLYSELSKLIIVNQIVCYDDNSKIIFIKSQRLLANELQTVYGRGMSRFDFENERLVAIINEIEADEKNEVLIDENSFEIIGFFQTNNKEFKAFNLIGNINAIKKFKENNYLEYNSINERDKILKILSKYKIKDIKFEKISTIHILKSIKLFDNTSLNMIFVIFVAIIICIISSCLDVLRSISEYKYQIKRGITKIKILSNIFLSDLIFFGSLIIFSMFLYYFIFSRYIQTLPDIVREVILLILISILLLIFKNLYFIHQIRRVSK